MSSNNDVFNIEIFGCARNNGKNFPKLSQTSFSGIIHSHERYSFLTISGNSRLLSKFLAYICSGIR